MRKFFVLTAAFTAIILGLAIAGASADEDDEYQTYLLHCGTQTFTVPYRADHHYTCPIAGGVQAQPLPDVVSQAIADQANRTCKGFCGPTQAQTNPVDCRYTFTCPAPAPAAAPRQQVAVSLPAISTAGAVPRIRAPNAGDGGLR